MILNKYLLIVILFSLIECKSESWEARLDKNSGSLQLVNEFTSAKELDIIFDRKAFSYVCYYGEDIELLGEVSKITNFKYNQIIIENESGQKRLYSNVYFQNDSEIKELPDENCMYDWYEYLKLNNIPTVVKITIPYLSDLKVNSDDRRVRLYYVFKPNVEQKSKGYSDLIIRSNWINLD